MTPSGLRIGFISTRLAGTDGVSLETEKWVTVLERMGNTCFFFAGQCDRDPGCSRVVTEAHFQHPDIDEIYRASFTQRNRPPEVTRRIHQLRDYLKEQVYAFSRDFEIDLMIVENALAIPMNLPLGLALTEFIAETGLPVIAHHHDFFWERQRFLVNCVWDYLNMAFPPHLPTIQHVVINSSGQNQLSLRTGISARLIPNVMDFDSPPQPPDEYTRNIRLDLGVAADEHLLLQPTRIVPRKGIEHAIDLAWRLKRKAHLVITHEAGDERYTYEQHLREYANLLNVPVSFAAQIIDNDRGELPDGRKVYTVWDVYPYADLVTYPSNFEGFGNAFLEAVYFRKPIVVNNYSIFDIDIKPKGFQVIEFDGFITDDTVEYTRQILDHPELAQEMVERNYELARRYYSYTTLERDLETLIRECFGED